MAAIELLRSRPPSRVGLGWAFFERQTNLWKRYWGWEVVWLMYGLVNTLAITFIANEASRTGSIAKAELPRLTMFLLIGTLVWAYMSAVLDDMSLTVMWERWEGTIEHTLMAPVPRVVHLVGMSAFGLLHALIRTSLIMVCALPFFHVALGRADWVTAAAVIATYICPSTPRSANPFVEKSTFYCEGCCGAAGYPLYYAGASDYTAVSCYDDAVNSVYTNLVGPTDPQVTGFFQGCAKIGVLSWTFLRPGVQPVRIESITDGTSTTIFCGELAGRPGAIRSASGRT